MNVDAMRAIDAGLVVTSVGGPGQPGYKQCFTREHYLNRMIEEIFQEEGIEFVTHPFDIHGSDERQYSSQGFRINTASITKDKYYEYTYYHTSLDNLDFVKAEYIQQTLGRHLKLIDKLEAMALYRSRVPNCEVMLSKHDLYPKTGGGMLPGQNTEVELDMILWLLFFCDGRRPLDDLAREQGFVLEDLRQVAEKLTARGILEKLTCG